MKTGMLAGWGRSLHMLKVWRNFTSPSALKRDLFIQRHLVWTLGYFEIRKDKLALNIYFRPCTKFYGAVFLVCFSWHHCRVGVSCVCSAAQSWLTLCSPWTAACQAPLSSGFLRQEYWSGFPFPIPGDPPYPGFEPESSVSWIGGQFPDH